MKKITYIPCIICHKRCRAKNHRAVVKICKQCRTPENLEKVKKMSLEEMQKYRDSWKESGFDKKSIKSTPTEKTITKLPVQQKPTIEGNVILNDFGEPLH